MHLDAAPLRRIAVCSYEGEMNVVMHGADGQLVMTLETGRLEIDIRDGGPGIPDIDLAMRAGPPPPTTSAKWASAPAWVCPT